MRREKLRPLRRGDPQRVQKHPRHHLEPWVETRVLSGPVPHEVEPRQRLIHRLSPHASEGDHRRDAVHSS